MMSRERTTASVQPMTTMTTVVTVRPKADSLSVRSSQRPSRVTPRTVRDRRSQRSRLRHRLGTGRARLAVLERHSAETAGLLTERDQDDIVGDHAAVGLRREALARVPARLLDDPGEIVVFLLE